MQYIIFQMCSNVTHFKAIISLSWKTLVKVLFDKDILMNLSNNCSGLLDLVHFYWCMHAHYLELAFFCVLCVSPKYTEIVSICTIVVLYAT